MNLQVLTSFCLINTLGLISPGPDFFMVLRNTLNSSKLNGIATAFGISIGTLILFTIGFFGVGAVISTNKTLFLLLKFFGFTYLAFLGLKSLFFLKTVDDKDLVKSNNNGKNLYLRYLLLGLYCNLSNPKALLYIISLATYIVNQENTLLNNCIYIIIAGISAFFWFSLVATIFDSKLIRIHFFKYQKQINIILGLLFLYIAIKIILL